jgi:SAND domain
MARQSIHPGLIWCLQGIFLVAQSRVICNCAECAGQPESQREMSATHFEAHAGAGAAKKWKSSVRIMAGAVPEAPIGAQHAP